MASGILLVVAAPAAVSVLFAAGVMYGLVEMAPPASHAAAPAAAPGAAPAGGPGAELVWEGGPVDGTVSVQVRMADPGFRCGDLYITLHSPGMRPYQETFTGTCAGEDGLIPDLPFEGAASEPGGYEIEVAVVNAGGPPVQIRETFTVK
ncbi:MAG: hypothetical protein MPI95_04135 [Nitrosopumilus sp.]|nr:hypothetical protein [Nitrosopumilus sp.]MDA7941767.1 hypothetical protein [Nitrosopumilus sp.]MDA7943698.1 hypothetical protein [Nitrosopumilus sp.]MDA7945563.1 hypothetical protein [Nitrosopumilus sp.]MDA7953428.1 hypothetical protein [Nitrosopumilus sp.]